MRVTFVAPKDVTWSERAIEMSQAPQAGERVRFADGDGCTFVVDRVTWDLIPDEGRAASIAGEPSAAVVVDLSLSERPTAKIVPIKRSMLEDEF